MESKQFQHNNQTPFVVTTAHIILSIVIISILTLLFYLPTLKYGFYFDDKAQILKYFKVRTNNFWNLFFVGPRWIAFWLNAIIYSVFKHSTVPYRLFNICLHVTTGSVIFALLYYGLKNLKSSTNRFFVHYAFSIALLTTGLFLLHPVQTQTITYVVQGQLEGLAGFFLISMSLLFVLAFTCSNWIARRCFLYLLFIFTFFSCGTKEIAIISPLLLLVIDWFFVAQGSIVALKRRFWAHGIIACIVSGLYVYILKPAFFKQVFSLNVAALHNPGNVLVQQAQAPVSTWFFLCSQFKVVVHYLWIYVWPFNLSADYDWKLVSTFFCVDVLVPLSLLGVALYYIYKLWRLAPDNIVLFAVCWFCIIIAPRSSIIPSPELLADYKAYIASLGWLFILAVILIKILSSYTKNFYIQTSFIFTLLIGCGVLTHERNKVWATALDFWQNIITNSPQKARSHNNYGIALCEEGRYQEAITALLRAIDLDPEYANPHINLSIAYAELGDIDKEIESLAKALAIDPTHYELYNNLATAFISKQEYEQAEKAFAYALSINPRYGKALYNKGMMYMQQNKIYPAWLAFKQCCMEADFDNERGFTAFAKVSMMLEYYDDAQCACKNLLAINPNNSYAHHARSKMGK